MASSFVYDVFLSFSGEDTRKNFTGHILASFDRHGFNTFRDDTKLKSGTEIGPGLLEAIEESRACVIVFSENYASSRWCLNELVKIMECNRLVIPIFYGVDTSHVRKQDGCYAKPFESHQKKYPLKLVDEWRWALDAAGNLPGYLLENISNGCESALIERVVGELAKELNYTCLNVAAYPVGIEPRVQQVSKFLQLGKAKTDIRIVAIWGIGGIGKTTVAKEMYNRIHRDFKRRSFLANIGRISMQSNGRVELQEQLLRDILMDRNQSITMEDNGIEVIKRRAWGQRVLLVLDDVNNINQLRALAIDRNLLSPGSRIIITTRDLSTISSLRVDEVYELEGLNNVDSLEHFSWHAFGRNCPEEDYETLSNDIVSYAKGFPLVLEVVGSYLSYRTIPEWTSEVNKLKKIPHHDVQAQLRLSLDSLDGEQMGLFLHIACFFVGMNKDLSNKILEGCGFEFDAGIGILSRRCLVSIDEHNRLMMHDLIQIMAREIVRGECPEEPGKRSRLWDHTDVMDVLENETGTGAIQGLVLNLPASEERQQNASIMKLDAKAFAEMKGLRLLHLNYVQLSGRYEHISKRLVWLSWKGFSSKYLPSSLFVNNLVTLDLSYSKLKEVWEETKVLSKLRYLNISHSYSLIKTPDFTGLTSLEELLLNDCKKLVDVHPSIRYLNNLVVLEIKNCVNLKKIPLSIFTLNSLRDINMDGCSKLLWPAFFQELQYQSSFPSLELSRNLTSLSMEDCNITHVPSNISHLVSLEYLNLSGNKFSNLPSTITSHPSLKVLFVNRCTRLQSLPALPLNLCRLRADYCTSLQSISTDSKVAKTSYTFYGCPNLVNNNFASNFRRYLLCYMQVTEQKQGDLNRYISESEIPSWFNYQSEYSEKNLLHFRVPHRLGQRIRGFILCFVISSCNLEVEQDDNNSSDHLPFLQGISDATKMSPELFLSPIDLRFLCPASSGDEMWLSYVSNRCFDCHRKLECGNEVQLNIGLRFGKWRVKKWGVRLVSEGDEEDPDSITMADENLVYPLSPKDSTWLPINNSLTFSWSLNVKKV